MEKKSNPSKLNFAVIGCGMLARSQHIPNLANSSKAVLHTCCDLSEQALAQCRDKFGALHTTKDYLEAINNPEVDAICLATTEKIRLGPIEAAARLGKPVYCEKPLARELEEMRQIQAVVKESGIPFCLGFNRRSSPAMIDARRIFRKHMTNPQPSPWRFDREGAHKAVLPEDGLASMSVRINDDWWSWKNWVFDKSQAPHGPMLFEMVHFTDLCNWFLAAQPASVTAMESGMLGSGVVISYQTGELATIMTSANGTFAYPKELYEIFGQSGAVIVDHMLEVRTAGIKGAPAKTIYPMLADRHPQIGQEGGLSGYLAKKQTALAEAAAAGDPSLIFTAEPDKGHAHALDHFIDEINGDGPQVCGVDEAVLATRVAFAAIKSAAKKRVVSMEEV